MLGSRGFTGFGESPQAACDQLIVMMVNFYDSYLRLRSQCRDLNVEVPAAIEPLLKEAQLFFNLREMGVSHLDGRHTMRYSLSKTWEEDRRRYAVAD